MTTTAASNSNDNIRIDRKTAKNNLENRNRKKNYSMGT